MMIEYQRQKLDELITWLYKFQDTHRYDMEDAIKLVEEIRDCPNLTAFIPEDSADSALMDAYFQGKRLELYQSVVADGTPFVCPGDDVYTCTGMTLGRFVELLGVRMKQRDGDK